MKRIVFPEVLVDDGQRTCPKDCPALSLHEHYNGDYFVCCAWDDEMLDDGPLGSCLRCAECIAAEVEP